MARPMTAQDRPAFVSVAEAARHLGVSGATIKRRIKAGTLDAELLRRPQGMEYRVRLPADVPAPSAERTNSEPTPPIDVTTRDVSAAITAATVPLVDRLAVQDAIIAEQATALRQLERENGRLTAQLTIAQAPITTQEAHQRPVASNLGAQAPDPTPELPDAPSNPRPSPVPAPIPPKPDGAGWWRRWWRAWATIVLL